MKESDRVYWKIYNCELHSQMQVWSLKEVVPEEQHEEYCARYYIAHEVFPSLLICDILRQILFSLFEQVVKADTSTH